MKKISDLASDDRIVRYTVILDKTTPCGVVVQHVD